MLSNNSCKQGYVLFVGRQIFDRLAVNCHLCQSFLPLLLVQTAMIKCVYSGTFLKGPSKYGYVILSVAIDS